VPLVWHHYGGSGAAQAPLRLLETGRVGPHILPDISYTGGTFARSLFRGRVTPTGLRRVVLLRRRAEPALVTAISREMGRRLFVGRLAADEGHRHCLPVVEGHQVGREARGDAPQALAEAEGGGGIGGGHENGLGKR